MSALLTGALYGFGGIIGIVVAAVIVRAAGRGLSGKQHTEAHQPEAASAAPSVPDLKAMDPDTLAAEVATCAAELDVTMRYALLRGVAVNVDTVDRNDPAYPNGRTQVRVTATGPSGKVWQWPP